MIGKVTRGSRLSGWLAYAVGPGEENEHEDPHVVAGDPHTMAWWSETELSRAGAMDLARHVEQPHRVYGTQVSGGHIWQCSLSLRADEGELSDQKWQAIAEDFMSEMGFDSQQGTKADMRWVAVRHGLSKNGNDHIHLSVCLVREDGTKADVWQDYRRAYQACRSVERRHELNRLEGAEFGRATVAYGRGEQRAEARRVARGRFEAARRRGEEKRTWESLTRTQKSTLIAAQQLADQPRWALARTVRAAATAAVDEAEFVRRMRRHGLLVRPRYAEGTRDVITGFSVARRPEKGSSERPIWYGGGSLARDLRLPYLRATSSWPDTPQNAIDAAAEWNAAARNRRPAKPGRELVEAIPIEVWREAETELASLREQLRAVPVEDRQAWAQVARQTAGAFAAWSVRIEGGQPGPLAATATALGRSAQLRERPVKEPAIRRHSWIGTASVLAAATTNGNGLMAQAVLLRQLANLAKAVHDAHRAVRDARQAQHIADTVRRELATVAARLPDAGVAAHATAIAAAQQARTAGPSESPGSPLPSKLPTQEQTNDARAAAARAHAAQASITPQGFER